MGTWVVINADWYYITAVQRAGDKRNFSFSQLNIIPEECLWSSFFVAVDHIAVLSNSALKRRTPALEAQGGEVYCAGLVVIIENTGRKAYDTQIGATIFQEISSVIVATIGIPRSATTWMYNLVLALAAHRPRPVDGYFIDVGDTLGALIADSDGHTLVVKTHVGSHDFWQAMPADAHFFVTTRDVRDGIASSRDMFPFVPFQQAIEYSRKAADFSIHAAQHQSAFVFRYEEKFFEQLSTVTAVADHLGIPLSADNAEKILDKLSRANVIKTIKKLQVEGVIGGDDDAASHDPLTQWHPGHVKDGRIGKYREILSEQESALIDVVFKDYMRQFYPENLSSQ